MKKYSFTDHKFTPLLFIGGFAAIALVVLAVSRAATGDISFEAEAGTRTGQASIAADATASNGQALFFARSASTRFSCGSYQALAPTGSGVVRNVSNQAQLQTALSAANPGDTINLASGNYTHIHYRSSVGYNHNSGTEANPIVIQAAQGASPVILGDNGPTDRAVYLARVSYVKVRGLKVVGGIFGMSTGATVGVDFEYNEVQDAGDAAVSIQAYFSDHSDVSSHSDIICNKIHGSGTHSPEFGEGIYIGNGSQVDDASHDVLIQGNEIYNVAADGIDIKASTYNITVRDNFIHDINFTIDSYGRAIGIGANEVNYRSGNYLIENNVFANLTSDRDGDAIAIAIGHGGTTLRNNVFYNIEDRGIYMQSTGGGYGFGNPSATDVYIYNNTLWGCGTVGCLQDLSNGRATVTARNNLSSATMGSGNRAAVSGDFVGPLTGTANAGEGPGSGFKLKSSSGAVNSAVPISGFNKDLEGTTRPLGSQWDFGAFESH